MDIGDAIVGLLMTLVILRITWQSFRTVQRDPGSELDVGDVDPSRAARGNAPGG
ncbi:MAG: hypothetical protein M3Q31_17290 [Actinomycetota bacterium]|nr:hypothetical protein [Actinomycetota bacterium]